MQAMELWDEISCFERYCALVRSRPALFANPSLGGYQIIADPALVRDVQMAVHQRRRAEQLSCHDLRVGVLADDPYVLVMREAVRFPDGQLGLYNRLLVPISVVVVPVLHEQIVVMHRYRHGTRQWHYEFPRGIVERGEAPEAAVRRELIEEIGAEPQSITRLGDLHASSGVTDEFGHLFLARVNGVGSPDRHEAVSRLELMPQADFRASVAAGKITDGPTLAAYAQAQARNLIA
jgi:ADP-ribose pyrophosphatase